MSERQSYKHGEFSWVDLMARDLSAAKGFYAAYFGWTPEDQNTQGGPPYVIFKKNGKGVAGAGQMPPDMMEQGIPAVWNSYINVDDLDATLKKAEELGGAVTMPAMQVMDAGRMAGIQDPTGAQVFLWQKGTHFGAELVNETHCFGWNELATRDIEVAMKFFGALFGWEYETTENPMTRYEMIQLAGRGNGGMIQMTEQWGDIPPNWIVYFTVEDINAATEKLASLGGTVHVPPFVAGEVGQISVVADPQDAVFSVIQMFAEPE